MSLLEDDKQLLDKERRLKAAKAIGWKESQCKKLVFVYQGEKKTINEWAKDFGLSPLLIYDRIFRQYKTIEEALNTPIGVRAKQEEKLSDKKTDRTNRKFGKLTHPSTRRIRIWATRSSSSLKNPRAFTPGS